MRTKIPELIEKVLEKLKIDPRDGSIVIYVGIVKKSKNGKTVKSLEVNIANREELERIINEKSIVIVREGELTPGEPIMIVACVGETRQEAFSRTMALVDKVKSILRKVERYENSQSSQA